MIPQKFQIPSTKSQISIKLQTLNSGNGFEAWIFRF
jgi:hypothetical protein